MVGTRRSMGPRGAGGWGGVRGLTQPPWSWIQPSSRSRRKSNVQPMMVLINSGTLVHRACGKWGGPQGLSLVPTAWGDWPPASLLTLSSPSCPSAVSFPLSVRISLINCNVDLAPVNCPVHKPSYGSLVPRMKNQKHTLALKALSDGSDLITFQFSSWFLHLIALLPHLYSHQIFHLLQDLGTC